MKTITFITNRSLSSCKPIKSSKYVRLNKEVGDKVKSHFYTSEHQDDDVVFVCDEHKDYIEQLVLISDLTNLPITGISAFVTKDGYAMLHAYLPIGKTTLEFLFCGPFTSKTPIKDIGTIKFKWEI